MIKPYDQVLIALRRIIRATDLHSKQLSKTTGLTSPQLLVMQTIRKYGESTIGRIASEVTLSQATVTTILDRLESRGLIQRIRGHEDKRKVYASLTGEGMELIRESPVPLQNHFIKRFQSLQEWEQSMIISSLQRVANMMDAAHIDASPVLYVGAIERGSDPGGDNIVKSNQG